MTHSARLYRPLQIVDAFRKWSTLPDVSRHDLDFSHTVRLMKFTRICGARSCINAGASGHSRLIVKGTDSPEEKQRGQRKLERV
jgi:hypothetical protein